MSREGVGGSERRQWSDRGLLGRLNREWCALQDEPSAGRAVRRWAGSCGVLERARDLDDVLVEVAADPDAVLGFLLGAFAAGDRLAGRVVLQAMLGKAVRMAAVDQVAVLDDYVTALWCVVADYPLVRRPTSVAANLALDTLKAVRREARQCTDVATEPDLLVAEADLRPSCVVGRQPVEPAGSVDAAGVIDLARRHRLVDDRTGDLLRSVYADGLSGRSAAARHGLTPVAVRIRCSRAVKVLAGHARLLAEVA